MTREITINNRALPVREYKGQRVVTFKDIDMVHGRADGTAHRNFKANRNRFIEGVDYFKVCEDEIRLHKIMNISPKAHEDVIFMTESGYLMLVKSFTDDLAWKVQRELVNNYFRAKEVIAEKPNKSLEIKEINAKVRLSNQFLKLSKVETLSTEYKNILAARAAEVLTGTQLIPLPKAAQKMYSAGEIGQMFGVSAQKIGRLSNEHNLKTAEYGDWYRSKSEHSSKEVDTFVYNDKAVEKFKSIFGVKEHNAEKGAAAK